MFDIEFDPWEDPVLQFDEAAVWHGRELAAATPFIEAGLAPLAPARGEGPGVRGTNSAAALLKCWRVDCDVLAPVDSDAGAYAGGSVERASTSAPGDSPGAKTQMHRRASSDRVCHRRGFRFLLMLSDEPLHHWGGR
jgi:hypothetical protein